MKSAPQSESICTYLDWDSEFFDCRIARANRSRLDDVGLDELLAWCVTNRIECLYLLAESNDPQTAHLAETNKFLLADMRMTFERMLREDPPMPASAVVRVAREDDVGALREIARTGHRDTRFYFDGHFDKAKCDLLYETWIEKSCQGFAEAVLVAEVNRKPVAYITSHLRDGEAQIGLMAVAEGQRGTGLGAILVQHFLAWAVKQGTGRATVITQGRNIRAQRLYQRTGFLTASSQLWYHRWFTG